MSCDIPKTGQTENNATAVSDFLPDRKAFRILSRRLFAIALGMGHQSLIVETNRDPVPVADVAPYFHALFKELTCVLVPPLIVFRQFRVVETLSHTILVPQ
ncbi:MAG: hypothetical protein V2G51_02085 [bacterium JZ-2024 1]